MKDWKQLFKLKSRSGFSLVEMSVALASVAAIVVVTVGGASLVQRSRLGSVVSDIQKFSHAVVKFEDKYKAIPGDLANVTTLNGAVAGNGNGSIDSSTESLQFWTQLSLAGLIKGKYDGTSTYAPGTGVPVSTLKGGGYNVLDPTGISLPSQAMVIELAGFTTISNSQPILTPDDAKSIDERMDDGNPNTGIVRAVGNSTDCVSSNAYNLTEKSASCRLRFIIRQSAQANDSVNVIHDISNGCGKAGSIREVSDSNKRCPVGFVGMITETCRINASNVGTWSGSLENPALESHCKPVVCQGNGKYGDKRVLPCMNGQTGAGVTQTCSAEGVWVTNEDPTSSGACEPNASACSLDDGTIRAPQACNWGQTGMVSQTCTAGFWETDSNSCSLITCDGPSNVGVTRNYSSGCGFNYTGAATETCAMDGNWKVTSNSCAPVYTGTCTVGADPSPAVAECPPGGGRNCRDIGCPPGETGSNIQICVATDSWTTLKDTCVPITCSGERVGTARIIQDAPCPAGRAGVVTEVCESNGATPPQGQWTPNFSHCATVMCTPDANQDGNATWGYAAAGEAGVSGECLSGYAGTPTRSCGSDGTWGAVTGGCTKKECSDSGINETVWPVTKANTQNVIGTNCAWPNFEGFPIADCTAAGTWSEKSSCKPSDLPIKAPGNGLKLWLDAADYSTLFSTTDCTTTRVQIDGAVGCWKDKSGNAYNAIAGDAPTYSVNAINRRSVLAFNGTSNYLENSALALSTTASIFAVASPGAGSSYKRIINNEANFYLGVGSTTNYFSSFYGNGSSWGTIADHGATGIMSPGTYYILTSVNNGTNDNAYINGTAMPVRANTMSAFSNGYKVGALSSTIQLWDGNIGEIIIYNTVLSSDDRKNVQLYLSQKWQIPVAEAPYTPVLWLDANDPSTIFTNPNCTTPGTPVDGGSVGCWKDKSTSANNFTQTTALKSPTNTAQQPVYRIYGAGNDNAVNFQTNSYQYLEKSYSASLNPVKNTIFVVLNRVFGLAIQHSAITSRNVAGAVNTGYFIYADSSDLWSGYVGGSGATWSGLSTSEGIVQGQLKLLTYQFQDKSQSLYANGILQATGNAAFTINSTRPTRVGGGNTESATVGAPFTGDITEILMYNDILSDNKRTFVENYLAKKWSIDSYAGVLGLKLWLDAQDTTTLYSNSNCTTAGVPANGGTLGCWKDKSGNSNNAVATDKPTYVTSAFNSKPAIRFASTNYMNTNLSAIANSNYSILAVVQRRSDVGNNYFIGNKFSVCDTNCGLHLGYLTSTRVRLDQINNGLTETIPAYTSPIPSLFAAWFDSSSGHYINIDNGTITKSNTEKTALITTADAWIGRGYMAAAQFNGDIGEIMVYNTSLSNTSRQDIQDYLVNKWGLSF